MRLEKGQGKEGSRIIILRNPMPPQNARYTPIGFTEIQNLAEQQAYESIHDFQVSFAHLPIHRRSTSVLCAFCHADDHPLLLNLSLQADLEQLFVNAMDCFTNFSVEYKVFG